MVDYDAINTSGGAKHSFKLGDDDKDDVWVDEYGLEEEYDEYDDDDEWVDESRVEMENDDAPAPDISGREIIMDYTDIFTNMDYFESRDALLSWVRQTGNEHNIVIVVKRSDNGQGNKKARMFLACERGGSYREKKKPATPKKKKAKKNEGEEEKSGRVTGTKKCGCPFMLKGTQESRFEWRLEVKCGTHNHPISPYLEGHSYAGRLTAEEEEFVVDMSKLHAPPKAVLTALKNKNEHNHSTLRTIYNARSKHRIHQYCGRSQLQYLMSQLVEHKYFHATRRCEETNTLNELFFAHPVSLQLVHAFPKVLMIDCTYKTNRYRLPYLEIVGVTSTGMTFCVASVYLMDEKEENYQWALQVLRDVLGSSSIPAVIITDRELALMNAVAKKFPEARHFLCTFHIDRNVLVNCKGQFKDVKKWEAFNSHFNYLWRSDTQYDFEEALREFKSKFPKKPVNYVLKQWITPYKERFVRAWTNEIMHFGNTTTNRVESHHASLKRMLGNSLGNFETCWVKCHTLFEACHVAIKASFEKSLNVAQHRFSLSVYDYLRGVVSTVALEKIFAEIKVIKRPGFDPKECEHILRKVYGLPCGHEIEEYVYCNKPIPVNAIDPFWRKLDMEPTPITTAEDPPTTHNKNRFEDVVDDMAELYKNFSSEEQLIFLKRMRELANSETTTLIEPSPKEDTRGRPKKGKKKKSDASTKRDPSLFEIVESQVGSCSAQKEATVITVDDSLSKPSFQKKGIPQKPPVFCRRTRNAKGIDFLRELPNTFQPYIVNINNVKGDGHCGFRAVASLQGWGADEWARVRMDLMNELSHNLKLYENAFVLKNHVPVILEKLNCFSDFARSKYWFSLPYMGCLVASCYNVALVVIDKRLSLTYLPFRNEVPQEPKSIWMGLINDNHFVELTMGAGRPLPPVVLSWTDHHLPIANGWLKAYNDGLIK